MKVQFIYTFDGAREQVITDYNDLWKAFLESKNVFLSYAMACLDTDEERSSLIKISCCIQTPKKLPEWYHATNGKFWVDDLEAWRKDNSFKSTVSKDFIKEFKLVNS